MEIEESEELTLAQEETIKKTLEEIRKQDPKKNKRVYPIVMLGDEYDDKDVYIAYLESRISPHSVNSYNCKRKTKS